jgi:hypothetical protein
MNFVNEFGPHKQLFMAKIWTLQVKKMKSGLEEMESRLTNP